VPQADDVVAGLVGCGPHVRVRLGVFVQARDGFGKGAVEHLAEMPGGHRGHVLDQSKQVRPGRHERPPYVVL
jgi:hypothetical protein